MAIADEFAKWRITPDLPDAERWLPELYPDVVNPLIRQGPNLNLRYGRNQEPPIQGLPNQWVVKVIPIVNDLRNPPREIELARRLGFCRQIVTHLDSFHDNENWYLVMEYCEAGTFKNWLDQNQAQLANHNPQVSEHFKAIVVDIVVGLRILEAFGLVHVDPIINNIGVQIIDGRVQACLLDFAAVREADDPDVDDNQDPNMNSLTDLVETCWDTLLQGEMLDLISLWPELAAVRGYLAQDDPHLSDALEKFNPSKALATTWVSVLALMDRLESSYLRKPELREFKLNFAESINCPGGSYLGPRLCLMFGPMLEHNGRFPEFQSETRETKILGWRSGAACFGFRLEANLRRLYIGELSNTEHNQQPKGWGIWLYSDGNKTFPVLGNTRYQAVIGMFGHNPEQIPGSLLPKTLIETGCLAYANCCTSAIQGREDEIGQLVILSNLRARSVVKDRIIHRRPADHKFTGEVVRNQKRDGLMEYAPNDRNLLTYCGQWLQNLWHGHGILTTTECVFEGEFFEGRFIWGLQINLVDHSIKHGVFINDGEMNGVWDHPDFKYEGGIVNHNFQGRGIKSDKLTGQRFDGIFNNGDFHGQGRMVKSEELTISNWVRGRIPGRARVQIISPEWDCILDPSLRNNPPNYRFGQANYTGHRNACSPRRLVEFEGFFLDHIPQWGRFTFAGEDHGSQLIFEGRLILTDDWKNLTIEQLHGTGKFSSPQEILYGIFVNGQLDDFVNSFAEFQARIISQTVASRTRTGLLDIPQYGQVQVTETAYGSFSGGRFRYGFVVFNNPWNPTQHFRYEVPFEGQQAEAAFILVETATQIQVRAYLGVNPHQSPADLLMQQRPDSRVVLNDEEATFEGTAALARQDGVGIKTIQARWVLATHFVEYQPRKTQEDVAVLHDSHHRITMIGRVVDGEFQPYEFKHGKIIFHLDNPKALQIAEAVLPKYQYVEVKETHHIRSDLMVLFGCRVHLPATASGMAHLWTAEKLSLTMESNEKGTNCCSLQGVGRLFVCLSDKEEPMLRFEGLIQDGSIQSGDGGRYHFHPDLDKCERNWKYYEGEYQNNKPHGKGRVVFEEKGSLRKGPEQLFYNGLPIDL